MRVGRANGVDKFLVAQPRSLGEACTEAGRDEGGRRCAHCPLKELCMSEERWLVKRYVPRSPRN
jgi:hypothetical protein